MEDHEARVNVTYGGQNGDLPDPVPFQSTDGDVKAWVTEAISNGDIPGLNAVPNANFADFVVDRFSATEARPYNLIQLRPKTAYGLNRETLRHLEDYGSQLMQMLGKFSSTGH